MNETRDLRHQVFSSTLLPELPPLLRLALADAPRVQEFLHELDHAIAGDPALAMLNAFGGRRVQGTSRSDTGTIDALKLRVVRQLLPGLFRGHHPRQIRLDAFWSRATMRAHVAQELAAHLAPTGTHLAGLAAFLADIGQLVLDIVSPAGFDNALEFAGAEGVMLLDAERREHGADHCQAGKWLLDRWRAGAALSQCAWLHHLPPALLDNTDYPIRLIDIVALAAQVTARASLPGEDAFTPRRAAIERMNRLGIDEDTLRACVQRAKRQHAATPSEETAATLPEQPAGTNWQQRAAHLEALCVLQEALAEAGEVQSALRCASEALRTVFQVPAGICYIETHGGALCGHIWRSLETPLHPIFTEAEEAANGSPLLSLLQRLAPSAAFGNAEFAPQEHYGLIALPLLHDGRMLGQFVADAEFAGLRWDHETLDLVSRFSRAIGAAIFRLVSLDALRREAEGLASALLRQELGLRQELRNERHAAAAQMAAGIAHELTAPLNAVQASARRLLELGPEAEREAQGLLAQAERLQRLTHDLGELSRPQEPQLMHTSLQALVHQVVGALRERLDSRHIVVYEEYDNDVPRVPVDRRQIEQVVGHLISNAERAMSAAGGVLTVRVRTANRGQMVVLRIGDTGAGIAHSDLGNVFEPFFTTHRERGATGMGMAVCRAIVERHLGTISVHSEPGAGATFTVTLPIAPESRAREHASEEAPEFMPGAVQERFTPRAEPQPAPANITASPSKRGGGSARTIVLVEANEDLREVLRASLAARGYRVEAVESVHEAQGIHGSLPDLILAGLDAPAGEVGIVRELAQAFPETPLVAIAGVMADDDAATALSDGAAACLQKPLEMDSLLRTLAQFLERPAVA